MGKLAASAPLASPQLHEVRAEPSLGEVGLLAELGAAVRKGAAGAPGAGADREELAKLRLLVNLKSTGFGVVAHDLGLLCCHCWRRMLPHSWR